MKGWEKISFIVEGGESTDNAMSATNDLQKEKDALKKFILGIGTNKDNADRKKEVKQISNFFIDRTLGEGTFGKVKQGVHTITSEKVAIKILEKDKIQD